MAEVEALESRNSLDPGLLRLIFGIPALWLELSVQTNRPAACGPGTPSHQLSCRFARTCGCKEGLDLVLLCCLLGFYFVAQGFLSDLVGRFEDKGRGRHC